MLTWLFQVVDISLDDDGGAPYVDPSELDEELLEPLRRQLGSLPYLTRLLLRGSTPSAFVLSELPPLRVRCTFPFCLLMLSTFACLRRLCPRCSCDARLPLAWADRSCLCRNWRSQATLQRADCQWRCCIASTC